MSAQQSIKGGIDHHTSMEVLVTDTAVIFGRDLSARIRTSGARHVVNVSDEHWSAKEWQDFMPFSTSGMEQTHSRKYKMVLM